MSILTPEKAFGILTKRGTICFQQVQAAQSANAVFSCGLAIFVLDCFMGGVFPIIAMVAVIAGIVIYAVVLSVRINRDRRDISAEELEDRRRAAKGARLKLKFFDSKNIAFYDALKRALPSNYIVFPRVAVELLFERLQRAELRLQGQYMDFCVFTDKFVPVLAVELRDHSMVSESTVGMKNSTKETIRNSGLPVLEYGMRDVYSTDDLRRAIAQKMNPLFGT